MNIYYVYAYLREDGTPYYIGKGSKRRAWEKHKRANGSDLRPRDYSRIQIIKQDLTEKEAWDLESSLIEQHGKLVNGGILVNSNNGGEGGRVLPIGSRAGKKNPRWGVKEDPVAKNKRLIEITRTKNRDNYKLYRHILEQIRQGRSACSLSKELGVNKGVCCRLKNGTHGIFIAFPELKQPETR
jgi:hypothetical protein